MGKSRRASRTLLLLLAGTALTVPAAAQATDQPQDVQAEIEALKQRVSELENLLNAALGRLQADEEILELQEAERVEQARRLEQIEENQNQMAELTREIGELEGVSQFFEREREPGFSIGATQVTYGGYLKADTAASVFSDGAPASSSPGRDFYIPSTIPVGDPQAEQTTFDFNPRETRFLFKTSTPFGEHVLESHLEFDFLVTFNDNELVSNSFTPRMRQAFLTYRGFLLGQAWTTFQDVAALPEHLDFIGPTEGVIFNRQPMIRYTHGPIEVAIENPETTVTAFDGSRIIADADNLPDFTARYTHKTPIGNIKLAGLFRQLRIGEGTTVNGGNGNVGFVTDQADAAFGYGFSLTGRLSVGQEGDNVRFGVNAGEGLGRYLGVAIIDGASIDENGQIDPIFAYSGFASYQHFWSTRWRSTFTGGYFRADNPVEATGFGVTDQVFSFHGNILYSPVNRLTVGIEYIFAQRRVEAGATGELNRFQFSARYGF